jgi:hypothetical protein
VLDAPLPEANRETTASLPDRSRHAALEEMAVRLGDLVFRRLSLSHRAELDEAALARCAAAMADALGWDPRRVAEELETVRRDRWWRLAPSGDASLSTPPADTRLANMGTLSQ